MSEIPLTTGYSRFNPRARGGRDRELRARQMECQCFNPRARGGRDPNPPANSFVKVDVSIHAPAGGATARRSAIGSLVECFNPRARGGRDALIALR